MALPVDEPAQPDPWPSAPDPWTHVPRDREPSSERDPWRPATRDPGPPARRLPGRPGRRDPRPSTEHDLQALRPPGRRDPRPSAEHDLGGLRPPGHRDPRPSTEHDLQALRPPGHRDPRPSTEHDLRGLRPPADDDPWKPARPNPWAHAQPERRERPDRPARQGEDPWSPAPPNPWTQPRPDGRQTGAAPLTGTPIEAPRPFPSPPRPIPHVIGQRQPGAHLSHLDRSAATTTDDPAQASRPAAGPRRAPTAPPRPMQGWLRSNYLVVITLGLTAVSAWLVLVMLRKPESTAAADHIAAFLDEAVSDTLRAERTAAFCTWIANVSTTFVLGGFVFSTFVDIHDAPHMTWSPNRALRGAALLGSAATLTALPLRAVAVAGIGRAALTDSEALRFVVSSRVGDAALLRIAGLLMTTFAVVELHDRPDLEPVRGAEARRDDLGAAPIPTPASQPARSRSIVNAVLGLVGVVLILSSYAWVGHPQATAGPGPLLVVGQSVHVLAASTWFGGVALLTAQMRWARRRHRSPRTSARLVARFSTLASVTVVVVAATGMALARSQLRSLDALTSTGYGKALAVKLTLVAIVLAIGGANRQMVVPAVVRRDTASGWRWLHRTVLLESLLIAGGVLLMTTVMTSGGL